MRQITFAEALREATQQCMREDERVYVMGLGVPDPKGTFGTTLGLQQEFGPGRVFDIPTSENGMTGIAIGSALVGRRPILTHQRIDFALLSVEQIINQAAKWHYMFGGKSNVPLVIRMIIGRGWGQGPQHSQSLQALFAHIPGLVVVMPTTPYDAKGLLVSSIENDNPVIFLEHRWLYNLKGEVPEEKYRVPLGAPRVVTPGDDLTIVATSYMAVEAIKAHPLLAQKEISTEIIDVRTLRPLDDTVIIESVKKTGRLIVADTGWTTCGFSAEIVARVSEQLHGYLKCAPRRIGLPDVPTPTSHALAKYYYPRVVDIVGTACAMLDRTTEGLDFGSDDSQKLDIPDPSFTGPF